MSTSQGWMETLLSPFRRTPPTVKKPSSHSSEEESDSEVSHGSAETDGEQQRERESQDSPLEWINGQGIPTQEPPSQAGVDDLMDEKHGDYSGPRRELLDQFGSCREKERQPVARNQFSRRSYLPKIEYVKITKLNFENLDEFKDSIQKVGYARQWPTRFYRPTQEDLRKVWSPAISETFDEEVCRREAYLVLHNAIPKELKYIVRRVPEGDSVGIWRAIYTRFLKVSSVDLTRQKLQFFQMSMVELKVYPDEFIALVAQKSANLKLVGVTITEADEISVLVNGLSSRFEWLKNNERISPTQTFDEMAVKVVQFAADHKLLKKSIDQSTSVAHKPRGGSLLVAAGTETKRKLPWKPKPKTASKFRDLKKVRCYRCKKMGHFAVNCSQVDSKKPVEKDQGVNEVPVLSTEEKGSTGKNWSLMAASPKEQYRSLWMFDSGSYCHVTNDLGDLQDPVPVPAGENTLIIGNGQSMQPTFVGSVQICSVTLQTVYFCEECPVKLLSEGVFVRKGFDVLKRNASKTVEVVAPDNTVVLQGDYNNGAFMLTKARKHTSTGPQMCVCAVESSSRQSVKVAFDEQTLQDYHQVVGHLNFPDCRKMLSMEESKQGDPICESCELSKSKVIARPREASTRSSQPIYRLFVDLSGRKKASLVNYRYFLLVTDDYSRKKWASWLQTKKASEVRDKLKEIVMRVEREKAPLKVSKIRTDGGKEFLGEFESWLREQGIEHELSAPYSQHQNGVVERNLGLVDENSRAMMLHANSPSYDWPYAVSHAVYLHNFVPSKAHGVGMPMAPNEVYQGVSVKLSMSAVFGCLGFAKVFVRGKQEPKARKVVCLGYNDHSRAFYVRDVSTFHNSLREYLARSVRWEKRVFPYRSKLVPRPTVPVLTHEDICEERKIEALRVQADGSEVLQPVSDAHHLDSEEVETNDSFDLLGEDVSSDELDEKHCDTHTIAEPSQEMDSVASEDSEDRARFSDFDMSSDSFGSDGSVPLEDPPPHYQVRRNSARLDSRSSSQKALEKIVTDLEGGTGGKFGSSKFMCVATSLLDPLTQKQAYAAFDSEDWKEAERKEIESILSLGTWRIVKREPNMHVLGSRFLYKRKRDPTGAILKRKARFIAQGHKMRPELDYHETFASTVHLQSVRVVLWLATFYRINADVQI